MSSGFPLANHLALPGSESILGIIQGPCLRMCARWIGFQHRGLWIGWYHILWVALLPFLACRDIFWTHVHRKVSLTLKMRNMRSLIWAGLSFPSSSSRKVCPQGTGSCCSTRDPAISCLNSKSCVWLCPPFYSEQMEWVAVCSTQGLKFLSIFVGEIFVGETSTGCISLLCLNM